ncbi:MAG: Rossmann-like domain-containing protein [Methanosarcinaceae archaeon]
MYSVIREKFELIVKENDLLNETVIIRAKPLTPEEAIGNPECEDFPILKGHERLMQAEFRGSFGQAYTDMHGNFEGTLRDILDMELTNNFRRAIFIASLNAVMRNLGLIKGSVHCKDRGPEECGEDLVEFLGKYGRSRIALIGFQPVHARCCSGTYELKILDMDCDNIGKEKFGVVVLDGSRYLEEVLKWCDLALVTGTTVVNGTIEPILDIARKKSVFYGISIAGVACLLGLERFCPQST